MRACLEVHKVLLRVGQPVGEEGVDEGAGVARRGVRRREEGRELLATHLALRTLLPEFAEVSAGGEHFQYPWGRVITTNLLQGVPSGRGLGFADMDLECSTILPGQ